MARACPAGFGWRKVPGGYECVGGAHTTKDINKTRSGPGGTCRSSCLALVSKNVPFVAVCLSPPIHIVVWSKASYLMHNSNITKERGIYTYISTASALNVSSK